MTCARCGQSIQGTPVQNLTGWEGRQLAIEGERFYCSDLHACIDRKLAAQRLVVA